MSITRQGASAARWMVLLVTVLVPCVRAHPGGGDTELIKKDLRQLAQEAELVVLARVVSSRAGWDAARRLIWTTTELDVAASWKGNAPRRLHVKELGGIVGEVGMRVPGAPRYARGEQVVVFLKKDVLGQWRTHGWTQGRFGLRPTKTGVRVRSDHRHVIAGFFGTAQVMGHAPLDLASFESKVRMLAAPPVQRRVPGQKGGK